MRSRDLTTIINNRRSSSYLSRALKMHWAVLGQYKRDDAKPCNPRLRRLPLQIKADPYGRVMPNYW
jgi:hypothetical protein